MAFSGDSEQELRSAVARLNSWLGADANARQWRRLLDLNLLDTQAALGYGADAGCLNNIYQRFNAGTQGLEHPVFRQVSNAISNHLDELNNRYLDVQSKVEASKKAYSSTGLEDLNTLRDRAIYELKLLKKYYKTSLSSRPRALLYYELKPDAIIELLDEIKFELPPTRGRDQIQSEISVIEKQIEMIDAQIEMLNKQRNQVEEWLNNLQRNRPQRGDEDPPGRMTARKPAMRRDPNWRCPMAPIRVPQFHLARLRIHRRTIN